MNQEAFSNSTRCMNQEAFSNSTRCTYQEENPSGIFQRLARPNVVIKLPWGVLPEKSCTGCAARFPKPFPSLSPKSALSYAIQFLTQPQIQYSVYDRCSGPVALKISYGGLLLMIFSIKVKKQLLPKNLLIQDQSAKATPYL